MKNRLGMGLIGPGFIARHHIDAVRRLGDVDVIALAGSHPESAARKAAEFKVDRIFTSYEELLRDTSIDVVHNTTPSYLHLPVSLAALRAGKHVISDKPLALTAAECMELREAAAEAGVVNAVTFNYRGNALVQEARLRVAKGKLGQVICIHGHYLQDWTTDENIYSWRMDPSKGGSSSALADIGSHWCDLAEHLSGLRITSVLADMSTVVKTRYAATDGSIEAFGPAKDNARFPVAIRSEDLATVLLLFENGARGSLKVGQVLPGHKNDLQLELNGREGSLRWEQERQNELWLGWQDRPNQVLPKDPALLLPEAARYAHLPGGHQESWADAFHNVIADAYGVIRSPGDPKPATLCTFADATRTVCIIEAMLRSAVDGGIWTEVVVPGESNLEARQVAALPYPRSETT